MAKQEFITFSWEGMDKSGSRIKDNISARTESLARAELRRQGFKVIRIKKKSNSLLSFNKRKINTKDIAIFSRQLATMLSAGVPLVQAFDIVGRGHDNPSMQDLLMTIKADVEGGNTLADSLSKHPDQFDELFCNLAHSGEQAGVLESLLHKIAEYKEKTESIKGKIKKALTYPIAILVVSFIVTAVLLIFVVPQFEELFKGFGAELPAFTQMVVDMSRFFQHYWWMVLGILIALGFVLGNLKRKSKAFNEGLDRFILHIPVVGAIIRKAAIARFARTLSTMSAAGVPLVMPLCIQMTFAPMAMASSTTGGTSTDF